MDGLRETLLDLGYSLSDCGKEFRALPIYRESKNRTSLKIDKQTGNFVDFSANISGSFEELVKLSLNLASVEDAKSWIKNKDESLLEKKYTKPKLKSNRVFGQGFIKDLILDHSYWQQRGISEETLKTFGGGVCKEGKMAGRYIFPIFDSKYNLIGVSGRDIYNNSQRAKWKHIGGKTEWKYPLFVNYQNILAENEVILVESIGDMLALWEAGIKNTIVLFGVALGEPVTICLLKMNLNRIVVALNNDEGNGLVGNKATKEIIKQLSNHFDPEQIVNGIPPAKDFGEMSKGEIIQWKKQLLLTVI